MLTLDRLNVRYEAEVTLDVFRTDPDSVLEKPPNQLPLDIVPFLLPSRFVLSDRLATFAFKEFDERPSGITAICNWIYDNINCQRGSSNKQTTATESLIKRAGVCRDFSHIGNASPVRSISQRGLCPVMPIGLSQGIFMPDSRLI